MSAKTILINRKTGKEVSASDPEMVIKKHPNIFRVKPGTKLAKDIEVKEATIVESSDKPKEKNKTKSADKKA